MAERRLTARRIAEQRAAEAQQRAMAMQPQGFREMLSFGFNPAAQLDLSVAERDAVAAGDFARGLEQQALQRQADAPGLYDAGVAAGVDLRQIPGALGALERGGPEVLNQLLQNPQAPVMQGIQNIRDQDRQAAQRRLALDEAAAERQVQADARARIERLAPLQAKGRDLENIRSMRNLLADEGRLLTPSPERGAYNALRGQLLNTLRRQFEAGALQAAELEFFETLLPDASTFTTTSQGERMAMLNELEYQLRTSLQDELLLTGEEGLTLDMFAGQGRSIEELISGGVPDGFVPGTGDQVTRPTRETAPEALIAPGIPVF